jgi:hypothetical protein
MRSWLFICSTIFVMTTAPILKAVALPTAELLPKENTVKGELPPFDSAKAGAKRLFEAIKAGDPQRAADFFFPAAAFDLVKAMAVPGRYHRKLVAWYDEDLVALHAQFKDPAWTFDKFERGHCKWQEKGTEGNALPYWSCRGNKVTAKSGDRTRTFDIHVLINWGKSWYVTHLGKVRKLVQQ